MPDVDVFRTFARYNQWMNEKTYAVCAGIDDAERRRNRGAFFKSIHGMLNHLLFADRVWLGRFIGRPYPIAPMGVDLYDDFQELRVARAAMDQDIVEWTAGLTEAWLSDSLTWTSGVDGLTGTRPRRLLVSHLFNHQTDGARCRLHRLAVDAGALPAKAAARRPKGSPSARRR